MLRRATAVLTLSLLAACSAGPEKDQAPPREIAGGVLVLEQAFEVSAADAWKAADGALEGGEFKVERRRRDDCGGKIVARREDGHRVTVTIHAPERAAAEVTVLVEPGDHGLLDTIQKRIGEKLSLKKARSELLGDTVLEASYDVDLGTALRNGTVTAAPHKAQSSFWQLTFDSRPAFLDEPPNTFRVRSVIEHADEADSDRRRGVWCRPRTLPAERRSCCAAFAASWSAISSRRATRLHLPGGGCGQRTRPEKDDLAAGQAGARAGDAAPARPPSPDAGARLSQTRARTRAQRPRRPQTVGSGHSEAADGLTMQNPPRRPIGPPQGACHGYAMNLRKALFGR